MRKNLGEYARAVRPFLKQRLLPLPPDAPRKLHLGCGTRRAAGWLNVDVRFTWATDFLDDVSTLQRFPDGYAEAIYACHVLEHFDFAETDRVLRRWHRVLGAGGELRISVPDLDRITALYQQHLDHFQKPGHLPWTGLIYGGQENRFDYHKNGFNFVSLKTQLESLGFRDVERYPIRPHFIAGLEDASLADAPFGEPISLNVVAKKR